MLFTPFKFQPKRLNIAVFAFWVNNDTHVTQFSALVVYYYRSTMDTRSQVKSYTYLLKASDIRYVEMLRVSFNRLLKAE